ncbi:DUF3274 domain-containing protein [Herbaspirillum sp. RTI4]|uniref:T6SS effector phospholipase Tle3 domain-containing protein n=1 Tax=Herbaspirillum sp. RTI4 TaxID=3048640 RepID=UPI002AB5BB92|nr:DUF3274 domain-containing protein [Herbaspirillum sp. RTI4]MDY7578175.1 DUF3274 domain-containing protein [Herbaspirillum sp. RTI4]MEA9980764.1 DUF3274 domain-containing protein [Herbaspirillum sp. RTI4]
MSTPEKKRVNLVVKGYEMQWLLPGGGRAYVPLTRPTAGIVILVHGVNDVGEAYPFQEQGICKGLNQRMFRGDDMQPANYTLPPVLKKGETFRPKDIHPDPDKVCFARAADSVNSPVIPFYWGFREVTTESSNKAKHGQQIDRYGNRLDKRYAKNGGPFANATTTLPDMFGPGFKRNIKIKLVDPKDPTHNLCSAPPRNYMVLAAQRLASLIRIIRKKSPHEPINIVAHSQGCLVSLLAHAILAKEGKEVKADTLIMNNPPYSDVDTLLEEVMIGSRQQTPTGREETLRALIHYITTNPANTPPFANLKKIKGGITGPKWEHNLNKERDNRGKVYLYFSPDDETVSMWAIQGIGARGVYNDLLERLGGRFYQRAFASRKERQVNAVPVGSPPSQRNQPNIRTINGEELPEPFFPEMGPSSLTLTPIDAAIATTSPYSGEGKEGMLPGETPEQAQVRWMRESEKNSYHSSIVSNPMHSEKATAYDLCLGLSDIMKDGDLTWIDFLRAVADWRTNWFGKDNARNKKKDPSYPPPPPELVTLLKDASQIDPAERAIIKGNYDYYCINGKHPGTLPQFTMDCTVESLAPYIDSDTIAKPKPRLRDQDLGAYDERRPERKRPPVQLPHR